APAIRAAAQAGGGHATLFKVSESGGDADKRVGVFHAAQAVVAQIGERLQQQLDPSGVFATGRM
ncbi:MAG: glycolate oxidase subunit GlcE, partial [Burkholderiaceae bacterium]